MSVPIETLISVYSQLVIQTDRLRRIIEQAKEAAAKAEICPSCQGGCGGVEALNYCACCMSFIRDGKFSAPPYGFRRDAPKPEATVPVSKLQALAD